MLKLLPRAEQGVLMMSSSLPSPTVQPAHTITWPAPPECSLWTWREVRLDTDWMNAVRAERERGGEDRQGQVETVTLPAWSHHSTSHHSQGRTENTKIIFNLLRIPPSFSQGWRPSIALVIILIYNSKGRISGGNQRCEIWTHFVEITASKSCLILFPSSDVARWPQDPILSCISTDSPNH